MPCRRLGYLLGFLVCAGLMGWALWLQYGLGLEPCPLCVFQRIAVFATGIVFLLAAHPQSGPRRRDLLCDAHAYHRGHRRRVRGVAGLDPGAAERLGGGVRHEPQLHDGVDAVADVLTRVLRGSGECAEKGWVFLGLAIPAWTLVFFVAMIAAAIALTRQD